MKIKVDAVIAYEIRGVKSFKSIVYEIDHWALAMQGLQKTKEWQPLKDLLWNNRTNSCITGITLHYIHGNELPDTDHSLLSERDPQLQKISPGEKRRG